MRRFAAIEIPRAPRYVLRRARVPACLLAAPPASAETDRDGALLLDIEIADAKLGAIAPSAPAAPDAIPTVDLAGCHAWPTLVDVHTHLDKCHIIDRTQNPAGDFAGARDGTSTDLVRYWRADDVRRRMDFGLRCAEAHGVSAIRTHIDSHEGQGDTSWAVLREMRQAWRGRIELQAAGMMPI